MKIKNNFQKTAFALDLGNAGIFSRNVTSAILMFLAGIVLLFVVGFAQGSGDFIHNIAHDTRHSAGFPCH